MTKSGTRLESQEKLLLMETGWKRNPPPQCYDKGVPGSAYPEAGVASGIARREETVWNESRETLLTSIASSVETGGTRMVATSISTPEESITGSNLNQAYIRLSTKAFSSALTESV